MSRLVIGGTVTVVGAVALVVACGPIYTDLITVRRTVPLDRQAYARGDLGIVRPQFERTFLVQAYRRFSDRPASPVLAKGQWDVDLPGAPGLTAWHTIPGAETVRTWLFIPDSYQAFTNCPDDAFATAARTHAARTATYGAASRELAEWLAAQNAVFRNCAGQELTLPEPAGSEDDALALADREYQTAAAYFYGREYEDAARRFRAIAAKAESPWRPYGRYLAARATIRRATVPDPPEPTRRALLEEADAELRAVAADASAAHLHASARGLLDFIAARLRPVERTRELASRLADGESVDPQDAIDYRTLLDQLVSPLVDYEYAAVGRRDALVAESPLTDWLLALQGGGEAAASRAVDQWRTTRSTPWLVAALWRIPPGHAEAPALLDSAARVAPSSPAFATVAFLRVRLLAARGARAEARTVLDTLPRAPDGAFTPDAISLVTALRFMLADSLDELLAAAPRTPLPDFGWKPFPVDEPVFDDDAGEVFTYHLPLARLVEASLADALPARLRLRVAGAAFVRAILLGRVEDARLVAPVLHALAPPLRADLDAFTAATDPDVRHRAAVRLLFRTPGLHATVRGFEDDSTYGKPEPRRSVRRADRTNWWCTLTPERPRDAYVRSALVTLLYGDAPVPAPAFLTSAERTAVRAELTAIQALGPATTWLGRGAIRWATARPKDLEAAEALSITVHGARWGCWGDKDDDVSRRAFQTLHRLFPGTEWAKRTPYWYR